MRASAVTGAIGALLIVWSGPTLYRIGVETRVSRMALARYEVTAIHANRAELGSHHIRVSDALGAQNVGEFHEVWAPVTIAIDGKDYSHDTLVRIRPKHADPNRYHGSLGLARLRDRKLGTERLGVIQSLHDPDVPRPDFKIRLLLVTPEGNVEEELFLHSERADPPYRYLFMHAASMASTGFVYPVLDVYPTLLYPLLFPLVTGATGLVLLLISATRFYRRGMRSVRDRGARNRT